MVKSFTREDRLNVGAAVIEEMKTLIEKGISPIAENGRFPAYKWAAARHALMQGARALSKKSAPITNLLAGKSARKRRSEIKAHATSSTQHGYPYSVQHKFPQKRERPVNLLLSGDMLSHLEAKPTATGVEIGFWDKLSALKEQGHREGVNDQPRRPIIPQGHESFSPSILRRLLAVVREIIGQKTK